MNGQPIYISKRTVKSLWQEYRIYQDRIELQWWSMCRPLVIPAKEILDIAIRPSVFNGGDWFTWAIKMDNADFCRHVLIRRKSGFMKRIAFSPDSPEEFAAACKSIILNL